MNRFIRLVAVLVVTAAASVVPVSGSTATEDHCGLPDSGQIEVTEVPEGTDAVECNIIGREIDLGDVVLAIPTPGEGVALHAQGDGDIQSHEETSGEIYTAPDGTVSYETDALLAGASEGSSSYDKDGCDSSYLGAFKIWEFYGTWNFYVDNEGQPGGSAYSPSDTGAALEEAGRTWHNELSPCFAEDHSRAGSLNYAGATTWNGDFKIVDGTSTCAGRDGRSVIDTGNLDRAGPGTLVGLNCTWFNNDDRVIESDIRFNVNDVDFTYRPGADSCDSNDYDVLSVMTHETGHTYGFKDLGDARNYYQTMYESSFVCRSWARNLGRADVRELRAKYPE